MIFGVDTSISIKCLNELRKQEVIDERIYRIKFLKQRVRKLRCKNLVLHGNNMIGILQKVKKTILTVLRTVFEPIFYSIFKF